MANSLMNWDPFRELDEVQDRMSQLVTRGFTGAGQWLSIPSTDIYEENGQLVVETALPHFAEDEVDAQINGDRLEIKAEHKADTEKKSRSYLRRESSQSSYYRTFVLPKDVDAESGEAHFANGVLKVTFNHKELPKPKKLSLKGSVKPVLLKGDKK